jgi:hypothetical protein
VEHEALVASGHPAHGAAPAHEEHHGHDGHHAHHTHHASTGVTLATRAANILAQAEDAVIFLGATAQQGPLFSGNGPLVNFRTNGFPSAPDQGLLNIPQPITGGPPATSLELQPVFSNAPPGGPYQETTVAAVASAYAYLQSEGQYGPYALVLSTFPYADAHSPLKFTLILPSQPIRELVTAGFYESGTLPPVAGAPGSLLPPAATVDYTNPNPAPAPQGPFPVKYTGVMVSLGGNTMDIVRASLDGEHDVAVAFEQKDVDGNYRFRVYQRFAFRLKDYTAVVRLDFV